jgi:hypothetical protein
LRQAEFQLSQIDAVIENEMARQKDAIDQERKDFVKDKGEDFRELFDSMNELKLAYLNKIIEYRETKSKYNSEYWKTFRDVEKRVGLNQHDPRSDFELRLYQRHQISGQYSPLVYMDELRGAFADGELPHATKTNKDTFKK